jgi:hypothetical protein
MAAKDEHPERYGWWINELESLGLSVKKTNEFNDLKEIRSLAEIIISKETGIMELVINICKPD